MAKAMSPNLESDEHQVPLQNKETKGSARRQRNGGNAGLEKEANDEARLASVHKAYCYPVWSWLILKSLFLLIH